MWTERKLREFRLFGHAVSSPIYIYIPAIYINVMSLDNFRGLVEGERERERGERASFVDSPWRAWLACLDPGSPRACVVAPWA